MQSESLPIVGVGAVVFHHHKVLLVKRRTPPNAGQWAIPGGKLHFGESLQQGAEREVMEETGIVIRAGEPVFAFDVIETNADDTVSMHYVVIDLAGTYLVGDPVGGGDASAARWFGVEELDDYPVNKTTRQLLNRYTVFEWRS